MKKEIKLLLCLIGIIFSCITCTKKASDNLPIIPAISFVNTSHLDYLYTPVTFANGAPAAGVYIYSQAPDYHLVAAVNEGYTCVDDVSRAALVYLRQTNFLTDSALQIKEFKLINFILEMQSANGYFYNFILTGNQININGPTSTNSQNWWSWRALQTLSESFTLIRMINVPLSLKIEFAINKLVQAIKKDLVGIPQTTKVINGIVIPKWLPAGSGSDQAAILILGLIPYCTVTQDAILTGYVKKLADGLSIMQQGDATHFPFSCFLSWENTWHAYGNDQAYALFKAGIFLNDMKYTSEAFAEVDNFYPWLLLNGMKSSFVVSRNSIQLQLISEKTYDQIAYGIRPMVFAATEAFRITGQQKYADIAGHLSAWFLGANVVGKSMYSLNTGRCYDGITSQANININSGAESTIEALLTMQRIESYPQIVIELNKYKK